MVGGACMAEGEGACMAGEGACIGRGMPGRRDGHCSGRYAFYWNAFLFPLILQRPSIFYYLLSLGNYIYRIFICVSHNTDVRTLAFQAYVARLSALIIYQ